MKSYLRRMGGGAVVGAILDLLKKDQSDDKEKNSEPRPFNNWKVTLTLDHPYWNQLTMTLDAPSWNGSNPDYFYFESQYDSRLAGIQSFIENFVPLTPFGAPVQRGPVPVPMPERPAQEPAGDRFCPTCRKMVFGNYCGECGTKTV